MLHRSFTRETVWQKNKNNYQTKTSLLFFVCFFFQLGLFSVPLISDVIYTLTLSPPQPWRARCFKLPKTATSTARTLSQHSTPSAPSNATKISLWKGATCWPVTPTATGLRRNPPAEVKWAQPSTRLSDAEEDRSATLIIILLVFVFHQHLQLQLLLSHRAWQQGALRHCQACLCLFGSWNDWNRKPTSLSWAGTASIPPLPFCKDLLHPHHCFLLSFLAAIRKTTPLHRSTKTALTVSFEAKNKGQMYIWTWIFCICMCLNLFIQLHFNNTTWLKSISIISELACLEYCVLFCFSSHDIFWNAEVLHFSPGEFRIEHIVPICL